MTAPTAELPTTLSTQQLAQLLGMHVNTLYAEARAGRPVIGLRPVKVGVRLHWPTSKVCAALGLDRAEVARQLGLDAAA